MNPNFEYLYLRELELQCQHANNAYKNLCAQLGIFSLGSNNTNLSDPRNEIFRAIHSFLTHSGNLSKLLWPGAAGPGTDRKTRQSRMNDRAIHLRQVLNLPAEGHPLENREVRNYLEHFDEDLDSWAANSLGRGLVALDNLAPLRMIEGNGIKRIRCFDPNNHDFVFLEKNVNLRELNEIINGLAIEISKNKEFARATSQKKAQHEIP